MFLFYKNNDRTVNISDIELPRRLAHSFGSILPFSYFILPEEHHVTLFFIILLVVGGVLEYIRLNHGFRVPGLQRLTRPYEQEKVAGYYLYICGCVIVWFVFSPVIAVTAMLLLAFCDPIGGILSTATVDEAKQAHVLVIVAVVGSCISYLLLTSHVTYAPIIALVGGVGAALADAYKLSIRGYIVDDNLVIPVFSAVLMVTTYVILTGTLLVKF